MKKILLCDDDEGIVDIVAIVLNEKGYDVTAITESDTFFSVVTKNIPDLILLDLWMPRIRGDVIVKKLKEKKDTKDIPIILFSASKDTQIITKEVGADAYLLKPFDINELEDIVAKYIK